MFKSIEEFQTFSKEQLEAATQSATAFTAGVQQVFAETTELSKKGFEAGTDAFQSLIASKSVDRALQVQMDFGKTAYDSMVAGSSKIGGIVSATAQDVFKPLEGMLGKVQSAVRSGVGA